MDGASGYNTTLYGQPDDVYSTFTGYKISSLLSHVGTDVVG